MFLEVLKVMHAHFVFIPFHVVIDLFAQHILSRGKSVLKVDAASLYVQATI